MKLTSIHIVFYLIFIICILLISYYYTSTTTLNNTILNNTTSQSKQSKTKEGFSDNTTINDALKEEINIELAKLNIPDVITRDKVFSYLTSLSSTLNKYKYIDAPITINNNGKLCDYWSNYNNGAHTAALNTCINIPGQTDRTCLNDNRLVSCSKYYNDGKIEQLNTIDTNDLVNSSKYNIYLGINEININLNKADTDMTKLLTDYIAKRNLANQQKYFIKYNDYNLEDKKKIISRTNKEFEQTENNVNINKIQFQQTVEQNNQSEAQKNKYYNYIFYTVILIIIVGILNFMFSKIN